MCLCLLFFKRNQFYPVPANVASLVSKYFLHFIFPVFFFSSIRFYLPRLEKIASLSLSNITNAAAEQRDLKQNHSVMLFTLVEGRLTKVRIELFFGGCKKIVCHFHCTLLPRDEGKHLVTMHHPTMNCGYAEIRYPYFFSDPEDHSHSLGDMGTTSIHIWDGKKLVSKDGETGAQEGKRQLNFDTADFDPTVNAAAVPTVVHPAKSEISVASKIEEGSINAQIRRKFFDKTPCKKIHELGPI